jgi:hypothetical protein
MTFDQYVPPPDMTHQEVFNMEFAELDDLLGEVEFQAISSESMTIGSVVSSHAISPESMRLTNDVSPTSLASPPSLQLEQSSAQVPFARVSPAYSIIGESDDDGSSLNAKVQSSHIQKKKATMKPVSSVATRDDHALAKKNRRREKNREHAKKCRSRKKNYLKSLEDSVVVLKTENLKLRRLLMTKCRPEEVAAFMNEPTTASSSDLLQSLREGCDDV